MRQHRNIFMLSNTEHGAVLGEVEKLASAHKEYRPIVKRIAQAQTQAEEIDLLLRFRDRLQHNKWGEFLNYDIDITHDIAYTYRPQEQEKAYAGGLNDEGGTDTFNITAYGNTFRDLYMEVIQLIAYNFYRIAPKVMPRTIVPVSACDLHDQDKYNNAEG